MSSCSKAKWKWHFYFFRECVCVRGCGGSGDLICTCQFSNDVKWGVQESLYLFLSQLVTLKCLPDGRSWCSSCKTWDGSRGISWANLRACWVQLSKKGFSRGWPTSLLRSSSILAFCRTERPDNQTGPPLCRILRMSQLAQKDISLLKKNNRSDAGFCDRCSPRLVF